MLNDRVDDTSFENERKAIYSEIDRLKDNDDRQSSIGLTKLAYKNQTYLSDLAGEHKDIEKLSQDEVQNHISDILNTNNLVVSMVGNLSLFKTKRLIKKIIIKSLTKTPPTITAMDDSFLCNDKSAMSFNTNSNKTTYVKIAFPFNLQGDYYGLKERLIISNYILPLFNNQAGIIRKKLRSENGLVYNGSVSFVTFKEKGLIFIKYKTNKSQINESLDLFADGIKNLEISESYFKELREIKKIRHDKEFPASLSNIDEDIYNSYKNYNKILNPKIKEKLFKQIKFEEVNNLIKSIFNQNLIFLHFFGSAEENDVYTIDQIQNKFFNLPKMQNDPKKK